MLRLDPLIVCGPSGVGKGTIIHKYMTERGGSEKFQFTISHTTRQAREGEVDGVHYHFVTTEMMRDLLRDGSFVESAQVHGNYYGTSWSALRAVQRTGKRSLLDIDVQGVQRIKKIANNNADFSLRGDRQEASSLRRSISSSSALSYLSLLSLQARSSPSLSSSEGLSHRSFQLQPKYLFIAPPSLRALEERLWGRKSESTESFRRRIENARSELEYGLTAGNFDAVVVNDDLDAAVRDFERAVRLLYGDSESNSTF
jgi:guanylate kinase